MTAEESVRTNQQTGNAAQLGDRPTSAPLEATGLGLTTRSVVLDGLRYLYPVITALLTGVMLLLGGIFPVLARWLRDEIDVRNLRDVVRTLGGFWIPTRVHQATEDLGMPLTRGQAPRLFDEITTLSKKLGTRPPKRIYLTYLPCCGVVDQGYSNNQPGLMLGLPLIDVLTLPELRAELVHELAHLARRDTARTAWAIRFVETLDLELEPRTEAPGFWEQLSPLWIWSRLSLAIGHACLGPVVRGQESRADRLAASIVGGDAVASALVKTAMVQPLFREVLCSYEMKSDALPNLYALFRQFWGHLPESLLTAMRHQILSSNNGPTDPAHPDLMDRIAAVQAYPTRASGTQTESAVRTLGDVAALEAQLHVRLFKLDRPEPSIFHRAGS